MRRLGMWVALGALVFGMSAPAWAQPNYTVSWRGEMRVIGYAFENFSDFDDTVDDSQAFYRQRWRLWTTVESNDKKARVVWALEIGDVTWGNGGGPSAGSWGGSSTRVGPGSGGGLGGDGVAVEHKNLYVQFDVPGMPGLDVLFGLHNIVFMSTPFGGFMDDDGFGIQINWKADPIDLQLYTVKISEGLQQASDDNDMYVARFGVNVTKDVRVTAEAMVVDADCFTNRLVTPAPGVGPGPGGPGTPAVTTAPGAATRTGTCVGADFGDNFWIGATASAKVAGMSVNAAAVYGQRAMFSDAANRNFDESGFGLFGSAQVPMGPASVWVHGWYTTGDSTRGPAAGVNAPLNADSDKLPLPIAGASFLSVPYVAEYLFGTRTLGSSFFETNFYADPTGTYGIGGSASVSVAPGLSAGGGVAYVGASDAAGPYGDWVIEIDGGANYSYNANLSFQLIGAYAIPDRGDEAWAVGWRTRFAF